MFKILRLSRALALVCAAGLFACKGEAQMVIIANPGVSVSSLTRSDLRDLFSGVSSSIGGLRVSPVLLKEGPIHEEMLTMYVGKSDSAFRASWRSLVFSGQGVMPKSLDSEAKMVEYVAHTAGAIGYINKETPHDGVKTLAVR